MRKLILFTVILFWLPKIYAQKAPDRSQPSPENVVKDSLSLSEKQPDTSVITIDDGIIPLKDYRTAIRVDSLWQAELTNSDLYPKMRESILEAPYQDQKAGPAYRGNLSTDTLKKRIAALDALTPFKIEYNPALASMIRFYLHRDKGVMERLMSLSLYYFPLFEKTLDKYNLPLELKYLPVIESALNPQAKSRVGATGLWQFMYATGKLQGLTVSSYVDERMDPVKSTEAAAQYLSQLYKIFGDWDLALASYNAGPGNVSRAIRRSGGKTNYWKLRRYLPRETANYVPAFFAAMYVFHYADDYGLTPYIPKAVYYNTDTIHIKQTIRFKQISAITGIDEDLIAFLNPSYKLHIIPFIKGKDYDLRLPKRLAGLFVANEDSIYHYTGGQLAHQNLPRYYLTKDKIHYRVRRGDYLGKIARRYHVSVRSIKRWNRLHSNNIRIGQRLLIYPKYPVASSHSQSVKPRVAETSKTSSATTSTVSPKIYTVKKGDTLWGIARKFDDISVSQIKKWNGISGKNLKPGMKLKISKG